MNTGERLAVVEQRQAVADKRIDDHEVRLTHVESRWAHLGGSWVALTIAAAALLAIAGIAANYLPRNAIQAAPLMLPSEHPQPPPAIQPR